MTSPCNLLWLFILGISFLRGMTAMEIPDGCGNDGDDSSTETDGCQTIETSKFVGAVNRKSLLVMQKLDNQNTGSRRRRQASYPGGPSRPTPEKPDGGGSDQDPPQGAPHGPDRPVLPMGPQAPEGGRPDPPQPPVPGAGRPTPPEEDTTGRPGGEGGEEVTDRPDPGVRPDPGFPNFGNPPFHRPSRPTHGPPPFNRTQVPMEREGLPSTDKEERRTNSRPKFGFGSLPEPPQRPKACVPNNNKFRNDTRHGNRFGRPAIFQPLALHFQDGNGLTLSSMFLAPKVSHVENCFQDESSLDPEWGRGETKVHMATMEYETSYEDLTVEIFYDLQVFEGDIFFLGRYLKPGTVEWTVSIRRVDANGEQCTICANIAFMVIDVLVDLRVWGEDLICKEDAFEQKFGGKSAMVVNRTYTLDGDIPMKLRCEDMVQKGNVYSIRYVAGDITHDPGFIPTSEEARPEDFEIYVGEESPEVSSAVPIRLVFPVCLLAFLINVVTLFGFYSG